MKKCRDNGMTYEESIDCVEEFFITVSNKKQTGVK